MLTALRGPRCEDDLLLAFMIAIIDFDVATMILPCSILFLPNHADEFPDSEFHA